MSKIKSPAEKKDVSLRKDRRNVYGECPTSSRRNIRLGKQRSHMEVRRAVNQELRSGKRPAEFINADSIDATTRDRIAELKRHAFKKVPDVPLATALARKQKVREQRGRRSK